MSGKSHTAPTLSFKMAAAQGRFAGQVAVVTGGADGLGRGITARLLSEGAIVVICDVNEKLMQDAVASFSELGFPVSHSLMDVASADSVKCAIDAVAEKYGRLDILINCAGIVGEYIYMSRKKGGRCIRALIEGNRKRLFFYPMIISGVHAYVLKGREMPKL